MDKKIIIAGAIVTAAVVGVFAWKGSSPKEAVKTPATEKEISQSQEPGEGEVSGGPSIEPGQAAVENFIFSVSWSGIQPAGSVYSVSPSKVVVSEGPGAADGTPAFEFSKATLTLEESSTAVSSTGEETPCGGAKKGCYRMKFRGELALADSSFVLGEPLLWCFSVYSSGGVVSTLKGHGECQASYVSAFWPAALEENSRWVVEGESSARQDWIFEKLEAVEVRLAGTLGVISCGFPQEKGEPNRSAKEEWSAVRRRLGEEAIAQALGSTKAVEQRAFRALDNEVTQADAIELSKSFIANLADGIITAIPAGGLGAKVLKDAVAVAASQLIEGKGVEKAVSKIAGRIFGESMGRLFGSQVLEKLSQGEAKEAAKKLTEAIKKSMEDGNLALITRPGGLMSRGNPSFAAVVIRTGCGKYSATITLEDEARGDTDGQQVVIKIDWEYKKDAGGSWQPVFSQAQLTWEKREK